MRSGPGRCASGGQGQGHRDEGGRAGRPGAEAPVSRPIGAEREQVAANTLGVWVAAIADAHRSGGHPDPTLDSGVREVMAGVRAEDTAEARAARRAPAATRPIVVPMITLAHDTATTWPEKARARRDIAVIAVTFAAALRRSETAALRRDDLTPVVGHDGQALLQVRIRGSKTSRTQLSHVYIPRGRGTALYCPWCASLRWLDIVDVADRAAAHEQRRRHRHELPPDDDAVTDAVAIAVQRFMIGDTSDPDAHRCADTDGWPSPVDGTAALLRPLAKGGWPLARKLSDRQIARIIEARSVAAGVGRMRGHSMRSGATTEALDRGTPLEDVMALTRHRNPATTLSYDRRREQRSARVDLGL